MSSAHITNWDTLSIIIENPSRRALNTNSLIPGFASFISGSLSIAGRELTSSIVQVISCIAAKTQSISIIPGVALIGNSLTNSVGVEVVSVCASFTDSVIPGVAVGIGGNIACSRSIGIDDASSVVYDVAEVAASTLSIIDVPFSALIADSYTDFIGIEVVFGGTCLTLIIFPFSASVVCWIGVGPGFTCSIGIDMVTIVALFANSNISVEDLTVLVDFAADSIFVKNVSE